MQSIDFLQRCQGISSEEKMTFVTNCAETTIYFKIKFKKLKAYHTSYTKTTQNR